MAEPIRVLAITDEPERLAALAPELVGTELVVTNGLTAGLARLGQGGWSLVLLDTAAAGDVLLDLVERLATGGHRVLVLARGGALSTALATLDRGASDVLSFPPTPAQLLERVGQSGIHGRAAAPVSAANEPTAVAASPSIVGESWTIRSAVRAAIRVADTKATVLLQGESGTGKELFAQLVHARSPRRVGPFVAVNCAAIPESLLESELFGHEKGAFTGATGRKIGRFERASGGTLFLDEVGDLSPSAQAKVLRALQEREIERVGGDGPVSVDVRVVAATNRDLAREVEAGNFREDLYYRLAVVEIALGPLRERGDDIRLIAESYLASFARAHRRPVRGMSPGALELLLSHGWPGNVRQLRNVIEHAVLLADGPLLLAAHLPAEVRERANTYRTTPAAQVADARPVAEGLLPLGELERRHISRALTMTDWHLARAADLLGIHRNTLRRKLQEYNIAAAESVSGEHAVFASQAVATSSATASRRARLAAAVAGASGASSYVPARARTVRLVEQIA
ncbi:MAG TPA: sigma-54 dependent transcriptional regulator [Gemmatimonadaceae bacterium]|nr:sigma-54 dependent transcriptional regulator [Gemmatimonadaceae bacterium]